ncbi:MAG: substrate-binding domain-containing protein [Proteobacteria bacterium]|uniref:PstS family phosphate ABC transporter substrate-binding protein n=1 Tax=Rudaea sp. TaxID=2136325 RepID=UPI001D3989B2|nr:substrate-binding domain-containing protein [Pseudomonadota bacterium]MBS0568896.1 substrate-binding domain-containing protein [Pseudomonadota bacterium]
MKTKFNTRRVKALALAAACTAALAAVFSPSAFALKYAAVEHHLKVDPAMPTWTPAQVATVPEEELALVGADVMDELCLGWAKIFRKAYPHLSVVLDLRASGAGAPGLIAGAKAPDSVIAPVGREMLPAEEKAFVDKFGYEPFRIKVATGSLGSLGKTATSIMLVDKDNPIKGLSLAQLDAMYSTTRKRGDADIKTWGDLGLTGKWATLPVHKYGLKAPNGIEWFFKINVMDMGDYKNDIEFVKGKGFTHAFNVAAEDMAKNPGGITYAMLANVEPNVKVVPLSVKDGGPYIAPTLETVYDHSYPLSRFVYIYVNRKPGTPLEPKVKEFLKMVLSKQGQEVVAQEGVYIPLQPKVVKEELAKLE